MEEPAQNTTLLGLHIPDFEKAKEFYSKLGFEVVWERPPEEQKGYLVIKRENNILCFWAGNEKVLDHGYFKKYSRDTKRGYAIEIVVMIKEIENFYHDMKKFVTIVEELEKKPWGLRDFRIEDPFGFYIRFTEPHNILDSKYAVA